MNLGKMLPPKKTHSPIARLVEHAADAIQKAEVAVAVAAAGIGAGAGTVRLLAKGIETRHRIWHGPRYAVGDFVRLEHTKDHSARAVTIIRPEPPGGWLVADGMLRQVVREQDISHVIYYGGPV